MRTQRVQMRVAASANEVAKNADEDVKSADAISSECK